MTLYDTAGKRYMGYKDLTGKVFFADKTRFAELMNVMLYQGKDIVKPENLVQMSREYPSPLKNGEKRRDILMKDIEQNICYGLELETESDYSMPERVLVYDVCEWETQIQEMSKRHERMNYRDKKSRIRQRDFLLPVVTVVLYLGTGHWQGKRRLTELFHIPEEIREMLSPVLPDYGFLLTEADYMDADAYRTDLREFFGALQCRGDKHKMAMLMQKECFRKLREDTAWMIAVYLDKQRLMGKIEKEGLDMCQALDELLEDKKREGKKAGRKEERMLIICSMLREGLDSALISKITGCSEEELMMAVNNNI